MKPQATFLVFSAALFVGWLFWSQPWKTQVPVEPASSTSTAVSEARMNPAIQAADQLPIPFSSTVTDADKKKLDVLEQVLNGKNDNDPRLDFDFKNLSQGAKELFRRKYESLAEEKRNERGTIVFLLGRNLASAEDLAFLESVLSEKPCLSLEKCDKAPTLGDGDSTHLESPTAVTLVYPQIVALKSIEREMANWDPSGSLMQAAMKTLETASNSDDPMVAHFAEKLMRIARKP